MISQQEIKTRNNGQWTEARFNSFVKSALRSASRRWPPKYGCLNAAYTGRKVNSKSGREAKHYRCAICLGEYPSKDVQIDHIKPLIDPAVGFTTWDDVINNMFCEADNLQCLCVGCHKIKTQSEKEIAKQWRSSTSKKPTKARSSSKRSSKDQN